MELDSQSNSKVEIYHQKWAQHKTQQCILDFGNVSEQPKWGKNFFLGREVSGLGKSAVWLIIQNSNHGLKGDGRDS